MTLPDHPPQTPEPLPPPAPSPLFGELKGRSSPLGTLIAWTLIVLLTTGWIISNRITTEQGGEGGSVPMPSQMVGRITMGMKDLLNWAGAPSDQALDAARPLTEASLSERVAYSILVAAIKSPEEGLAHLEEALPLEDLSEADRRLVAEVGSKLEAWKSGASQADRTLPDEEALRLGYFAEVLSGAAQPAPGFFIRLALFGLWYGLAALVGIVLLIAIIIFVGVGALKSRIGPPIERGGIYAETFALWLLLFLSSFNLLGGVVEAFEWSNAAPAVAIIAMFGSLTALVWPILRGVPWQVLRADVGLHFGRNPLVETLYGFAAYTVALPLMGLGLLLMMLLARLVGSETTPSHPAVEGAASGRGLQLVLLFLLACVAAPIVEEIMFRGVLFRHLREAGRGTGALVSFGFAALLSSFIFAAIHPQGLIFTPVLGGLAVGFCIARELRGSLWPGMVAHAIVNFVTLSLNVVLMSS